MYEEVRGRPYGAYLSKNASLYRNYYKI